MHHTHAVELATIWTHRFRTTFFLVFLGNVRLYLRRRHVLILGTNPQGSKNPVTAESRLFFSITFFLALLLPF